MGTYARRSDLRISAPEGHDVSAGSPQSSGIAAMTGMRRPGIWEPSRTR